MGQMIKRQIRELNKRSSVRKPLSRRCAATWAWRCTRYVGLVPCTEHWLTLNGEINPDGHCLYSAVADQLSILSIIPAQQATYKTTRAAAAAYMLQHRDDFLPFLPSLDGEDGVGATSAGMLTPQQYAQYCAAVRDSGTWGGEPEIMALTRAFNIPIHVAQWGSPSIVCHSPTGAPVDPRERSVKISYHRRMYGLGEVSLRWLALQLSLRKYLSIALQQPAAEDQRLSKGCRYPKRHCVAITVAVNVPQIPVDDEDRLKFNFVLGIGILPVIYL